MAPIEIPKYFSPKRPRWLNKQLECQSGIIYLGGKTISQEVWGGKFLIFQIRVLKTHRQNQFFIKYYGLTLPTQNTSNRDFSSVVKLQYHQSATTDSIFTYLEKSNPLTCHRQIKNKGPQHQHNKKHPTNKLCALNFSS